MDECKYNRTDEFGVIREFNSEKELEEYLKNKNAKTNESELQQKLEELNKDEAKKEELNVVLKKIGEIFDGIKNNAKEILELSKKNPNLSAAVRSVIDIDRAFIKEQINQAAFVFKTIQEYSVIGKHLNEKILEIRTEFLEGKKSRQDAYNEMMQIESYYFGIGKIAFSLEDFVRGFLLNSEEPIFMEFKKIDNHYAAIKKVSKELQLDFQADRAFEELGEDPNATLDETIRAKTVEMERALARGNEKRANKKKEEIEKLNAKRITLDSIKESLKMGGGKSNQYSNIFETLIRNSNIVLSSYRKKLQRLTYKAKTRTMAEVVDPLNEIYKEFIKNSGRPTYNPKETFKGLYEVVERSRFDEDTNEIVKETFVELNKRWNFALMTQHEAEWEQKIFNAKDEDELFELKKQYKKWQIENFQQEYSDEVNNLRDLLTKDATDALDEVNGEIRLKLRELNEGYTKDLEKELVLLTIKKNSLGYRYDYRRRLKPAKELAIAESILAYRKAMADTYEDPTEEDEAEARMDKELHYTAFKLALEKKKAIIGYEGASKELIDAEEKRWKATHERRVIHKSFQEERSKLFEEITLVKQKLGLSIVKSEKENKLWDNIQEIVSNYRDKNRVIQGEYLSSSEIVKIKQLQQDIEIEKKETRELVGVTSEEYARVRAIKDKYPMATFDYKDIIHTPVEDRLPDYEEDLAFLQEFHKKKEAAKTNKAKKDSALSEEELEEKLELTKKLDELNEKLFKMQESVFTANYLEEYDKQLKLFIDKYRDQGVVVTETDFRNMENPEDMIEKMYSGEFIENTWFRENHRISERYNKETRSYETKVDPLYVWLEYLPTDKSLIEYKPAFFYYKNKIKEKYRNLSREIDPFHGDNLPKRGGIYDKKNEYDSLEPAVKNTLDKLTAHYAKLQNLIQEPYLRNGYKTPTLEKETLDRLLEGQYSFSNIKNVVMRNIRVTEDDKEEGLGHLAVSKYNRYSNIPVPGATALKELDASFDLFAAISNYGEKVVTRSEFTQEFIYGQDLYGLIKGEDSQLHLADKNVNSWNVMKSLRSLKDARANTAATLEQMLKTVILGESRTPEEEGSVSFHKIVGNFNKLAALNTLVWGIPSQVMNVLTAKAQILIQTHGGHMANKNDQKEGEKKYLQRARHLIGDLLEKRMGEYSYVTKVVLNWGFIQNSLDDAHKGYSENNFKQFVNSKFGGNFARALGENQAQVSFGYAVLNKKVLTVGKDKKLYTLLEFYEELAKNYGIYRYEDLLNSPHKDKYELPEGEWSQKKEDDLKMQILDVNITVNGLHERLHKPLFEKTPLGAAVSFFRKHIIPGITERFEGERFNIVHNRHRQGQYRTFWYKIIEPLYKRQFDEFQDTVREIIKKDPNGTLTDADRENLRKISMELTIIIITTLLVFSIGDDNDDLKKHSFLTLYALYFSKKLKSETEQFMPGFNLNELIGVLKTPSIALNQLSMYREALKHLKYTVLGDEKAYYQKDTYGFYKEGDSKLLKDILALGVGFKGSTFYPEQLVRNFDFAQRNR
jgi:hypothetical protein